MKRQGRGKEGGWIGCMFSYSSTICQAASGSTVWIKGLKEQGVVDRPRLLLLHVAFFVSAFILVRPFVKRSTLSSWPTHELDAITLTNPLTRITCITWAVTSSKFNRKLISCYCWNVFCLLSIEAQNLVISPIAVIWFLCSVRLLTGVGDKDVVLVFVLNVHVHLFPYLCLAALVHSERNRNL